MSQLPTTAEAHALLDAVRRQGVMDVVRGATFAGVVLLAWVSLHPFTDLSNVLLVDLTNGNETLTYLLFAAFAVLMLGLVARDNWPALMVAFPETMQGPYESWMPIPQVTLQGYPEFGGYLLRSALDAHFDLASSQELRPDHGVILPLHHLRPEMDLPVTIILQNCVQPPLPTLRRCYEFGRFLGQAIANWPRPDRFALIGVGGISHWIGTKGTGRIDADWDRWFLDLVCSGRTEDIANLPPESIEREAGNGGEEIRNWLTVMAALGNPRADLIAYEPVADWICCGAVVNFHVNGKH